MIGTPIAVGLWVWRERPDELFGRMLVIAGFAWSITMFAESSNSVAYSIGRVGDWLAEAVLVALVLSFPSGRLTGSLERRIMLAAAAIVVLFYLPSALLVDQYPVPNDVTSCVEGCPDNAFMAVASQPGFVDDWFIPLRVLLSVALFAAVLVVLARRIARSGHSTRRALVPVLAVAMLRGALFIAYLLIRGVAPDSPVLNTLGWIYVLTLPGIAVAFGIGLLRSRLAEGRALQDLALGLRRHPSPDQLTTALRRTMDDPSLELAYWVSDAPARWVDAGGRVVDVPAERSGRSLAEVRDGDRRVAAIIHDEALHEDGRFVEAAASLALTSLENQRLTAEVEATLEELRGSRARIQAAADTERRRIERDLHDGAQQRLVALRIGLGLAGDLMREDPARGAQLLEELGTEAEEALEEVRSLAHGVYPPLLADEGLYEALRALGRRSSIETSVAARNVGRYPPEVESAVYFCCLEALQNAAKYAHGAQAMAISVYGGRELRFSVYDDGAGFVVADARAGAGFTNMRDRLAAVGGELALVSEPGAGTRVSGTIPL